MNMDQLKRLDPFYQGLLMIICGSALLMHSLGILEPGFTVVIMLFSIYLILQGMIITGLYDKISRMLKKQQP